MDGATVEAEIQGRVDQVRSELFSDEERVRRAIQVVQVEVEPLEILSDEIPQSLLEEFSKRQAATKELSQLVISKQKALKIEEAALVSRIKAGAKVEPGALMATVKESNLREISWRAVVVRLKSERYCQWLLKLRKPKTVLSLEVKSSVEIKVTT